MIWKLPTFSLANPGGFKERGVLSREEFAAGLQISQAIEKGLNTLTEDQQCVLRVFQDGVGCAPRRTEKLSDDVINNAVDALPIRHKS